jgi:hypothetical protein
LRRTVAQAGHGLRSASTWLSEALGWPISIFVLKRLELKLLNKSYSTIALPVRSASPKNPVRSMTAFIFRASNDFHGKIKISDFSDLQRGIKAFSIQKGPIPEFSFIEVQGKTWTILDSDSLEMVEGRVSRESQTTFLSKKARRRPNETAHCYVHLGGEKRGPYLLGQIRVMWQNGQITADSALSWEDTSEPVPIKEVLTSTNTILGTKKTSTSGIKIFGIVMLVSGSLGLLYYRLLFDSTVYSSYSGRIHNIGLMQDRQIGLIISGLAVILGFVCVLIGRASAKSRS